MEPGLMKKIGMVFLAVGVFSPFFLPVGASGCVAGLLIVVGIVWFVAGNRGLKVESESADADTAADPEPTADPAGSDPP